MLYYFCVYYDYCLSSLLEDLVEKLSCVCWYHVLFIFCSSSFIFWTFILMLSSFLLTSPHLHAPSTKFDKMLLIFSHIIKFLLISIHFYVSSLLFPPHYISSLLPTAPHLSHPHFHNLWLKNKTALCWGLVRAFATVFVKYNSFFCLLTHKL